MKKSPTLYSSIQSSTVCSRPTGSDDKVQAVFVLSLIHKKFDEKTKFYFIGYEISIKYLQAVLVLNLFYEKSIPRQLRLDIDQ